MHIWVSVLLHYTEYIVPYIGSRISLFYTTCWQFTQWTEIHLIIGHWSGLNHSQWRKKYAQCKILLHISAKKVLQVAHSKKWTCLHFKIQSRVGLEWAYVDKIWPHTLTEQLYDRECEGLDCDTDWLLLFEIDSDPWYTGNGVRPSYRAACVDLPSHLLSADCTPDMRVRQKACETRLAMCCRDTKTKNSNTYRFWYRYRYWTSLSIRAHAHGGGRLVRNTAN